jgi:hypothetical protein
MVGATPAAAAAIVNGCCTLMATNPTMFTIFILHCIYIFRASLSKIFLYFLSLKRYLFKHQRVHTSTKENLLQVLATNSFGLPRIKHKLLTTLVRDNERD